MKKFIWESPYMLEGVLVDAAMKVKNGEVNTVADEVWDKIKSNPHVRLVDEPAKDAAAEPSTDVAQPVAEPYVAAKVVDSSKTDKPAV